MLIGVPLERKPLEGRVGLIPAACSGLVAAGHQVLIETGAGRLSGYSDNAYQATGAEIAADADELYCRSTLIVKVKEPIETDLQYLRPEHMLFSFLHLAANTTLTQKLCEIGLTALAFETIQTATNELPLLAPMSDIAGRLSVQIGTNLLHQPQGGKGLLLGGLAGAERGRVTVIGAGNAGGNAARMAAALGANVTVFDQQRERLEAMRALGNNVTALYPYPETLDLAVVNADLVIGAVLVTGARAPHLVTAEQVARMQAGSVIVDISVDQGGCIETTRPTDYRDPTYTVDGVVHLAVTNLPGAVPHSASQALSAALMPYLMKLADGQLDETPALQAGINVQAGKICHPALLNAQESQ